MENFNLLYWLRLLPGPIIGLWIAWKVKNHIRPLVVRLMPVRQRISEKSFDIQTRVSTMTAFSLALCIAFLVNWGIFEASLALGLITQNQKEMPQQETSRTIPRTTTIPKPLNTANPEKDSLVESTPEAAPKSIAPTLADTLQRLFFIQLFSFQEEDRALTQQNIWKAKLKVTIWTAKSRGNDLTYKVLAGPFNTREAAEVARQQQHIPGYTRSVRELKFEE